MKSKYLSFKAIPSFCSCFLTKVCSYIIALYAYLLSFVKKTQPLSDVASQQAEADAEFDKLWAEGRIEGWSDALNGSAKPEEDGEGAGIWCSACKACYTLRVKLN